MRGDQEERIFRSHLPRVAVPEVSISNYVFRHAPRLGDKRAIVDAASGASVTYQELVSRSSSFARGLLSEGLSDGDVVAVLAPNMVEYPILFHGVAMAGNTLTTLNPLYTAEEIRQQLLLSGASLLVTVPQLTDKAKEAVAGTDVTRVVVVGGDGDGTLENFAKWLVEGREGQVMIEPATQVVALPFSSGTTGLPKGVMLTHRNLLASLSAVEVAVPLHEDDVTLAVLPFFHIYGMNVIMNPTLASGGTIVTMARFELRAFLQAIQDFRVTVAFAAPPMVLALAQDPMVEEYDLSSLRWLMSAAAPLDARTAAQAEQRLGSLVFQAYGMTESSPGVFATVPTDPGPQDSVGLLLPNLECRVVDLATGADLDVGEDGEILVRGPQIMAGYLKNPEATALAIDHEGFYRSGDVGHVDEHGRWFIVDRVKELIKYKGYQVAPAELEALLLSHDDVTDSAVIGVPVGDDGEHPIAFVVTSSPLDPSDLTQFVSDRVAHFKRIRQIEFVDSIPRSASGKILRRVLKDEFVARSSKRDDN